MFSNFFFAYFLTLEAIKCLLSDHGILYIHIMLRYLIMYILLLVERILVLFSAQNELRKKKKGLIAVHKQLWDRYSFTFQRIALQYEGKAFLIFFFCTQNTHHTEGIQNFFSGLFFSVVNSSKQQLSLLYLNDILHIESTLSLSSKKTSHSTYFTVIFKSATHIP